jgi:hypothetical protein
MLHIRRGFIQPIGDFPGRGFPVVSSQKSQLGGRPAGFFSPADVHLAELFLHRNQRTFELARQHHCACGRILLFQKRDFRFRVRPLYVWSFCDFRALPVKFLQHTFLRLRRNLLSIYKLSSAQAAKPPNGRTLERTTGKVNH